jgi:hypothetical protein
LILIVVRVVAEDWILGNVAEPDVVPPMYPAALEPEQEEQA